MRCGAEQGGAQRGNREDGAGDASTVGREQSRCSFCQIALMFSERCCIQRLYTAVNRLHVCFVSTNTPPDPPERVVLFTGDCLPCDSDYWEETTTALGKPFSWLVCNPGGLIEEYHQTVIYSPSHGNARVWETQI